jgi:hypothetical protein
MTFSTEIGFIGSFAVAPYTADALPAELPSRVHSGAREMRGLIRRAAQPGQSHGLKDKTVGHVFRLREGKVARFDIQDA